MYCQRNNYHFGASQIRPFLKTTCCELTKIKRMSESIVVWLHARYKGETRGSKKMKPPELELSIGNR